ncbi:secondary thiamine-phosphate synthase enzyme YjbQ [Ningiella sp. W23]|uniref:secondary thiamine-phosphate synthase enzyme YjbQ n=1 Tax=Ningiella sp. W23 TaxID=3023715 RepID=UPI0037566222
MVKQYTLQLPPFARGFHIITDNILNAIGELPESGLLSVFIQHTSASLTINENADPSVRRDLERHTNILAPENAPYFEHTFEGSDDMPAHIKASLYGSSVNVPILNSRLGLGTWQGIYLGEHRDHGGRRRLLLTVIS